MEFLVVVDFEVVGEAQGRHEIVEWPWAVFELATGDVLDAKQMFIMPQWSAAPPRANQAAADHAIWAQSLAEALQLFDQYLYHSFILPGRSFALVSDGPWDVTRVLVSEAARKGLLLHDHYRLFFDLRAEFSRCYPSAPFPLDRQSMNHFLSIPKELPAVSHADSVNECLHVARILARMRSDGHQFSDPLEVPPNEWSIVASAARLLSAAASAAAAQPPLVVRLRGLPWTCSEEDVFNFFEGVPILPGGIHFVLNAHRRATGEAFAQLAPDPMALENALALHRATMGKRYIEVFRSSLQEMGAVLGRADARRALDSDHSINSGIYHSKGAASSAYLSHQVASSYVVRMRDVPRTVSEEQLMLVLDGVELAGPLAIHFASNRRRSGDIFVEVPTDAMAKKVLSRNKSTVGTWLVDIVRSSHAELNAAATTTVRPL